MSSIKELVKKHFNLVEATTEETFGEIKSADGELTLTYEGEELAQGLAIFVVTADGNIPAPDGEHALEGGVTIVTKDGKIEAIKESASEEEEAMEEEIAAEEVEEKMAEQDDEEKMEEEEEMMESPVEAVAEAVSEEVSEEIAEVVEDAIDSELVSAIAESVKEVVEEMKKEYDEKISAMEEKLSQFSKSPATEKTVAQKTFSNESNNSGKQGGRRGAFIDQLVAAKRKQK